MLPCEKQVVILGAGPAGLTAGFQLAKSNIPVIILEKSYQFGGISRTEQYKGYLFDLGGHRFFTKVKAVEDIWHEVLSEDEFLTRKRLSRIYFNRKFYSYPIRFYETLSKLGVWNSLAIFSSFIKAKVFPYRENNLEQWVINRFGKKLYEKFFKTYTEKVWGIPCNQISADWAAQRIKGLSFLTTIKSTFRKNGLRDNNGVIKTLIGEFDYPVRGPGMMWERMSKLIQQKGGEIERGSKVNGIEWNITDGITSVFTENNGTRQNISGTHFINSLPISELIKIMNPIPPQKVIDAANNLKYRDFLIVTLIINKPDIFADNWIYVHDPQVKVGRIQNFKNWSPAMVPDHTKTSLGLEYFCFEGDGLWQMTDKELIKLGSIELSHIGLVDPEDVIDGKIVRVPKAYPVYDANYQSDLNIIREFLAGIKNFYTVGRNGMHKYNNQDHSMYTAMLAVENILGKNHNLWLVNTEEKYHEEKSGNEEEIIQDIRRTQPIIPKKIA